MSLRSRSSSVATCFRCVKPALLNMSLYCPILMLTSQSWIEVSSVHSSFGDLESAMVIREEEKGVGWERVSR